MQKATQSAARVKLATGHSGNIVLGIDAGGSKTQAAIGNSTQLLSTGKGGPANLHTVSEADLVKHLSVAIAQAISGARLVPTVKFSSVVVGMAGINSPTDLMKAERLVQLALQRHVQKTTPIQVVNDIHLVLRSGSDASYGVALIAGTGSHCFGKNALGDIAYAGGLDYLLADEGSGYEMGLKVLRAAIQSADGRIKPTKLEAAVLKHFNIKSVRALEPIAYHQRFTKTDIAKLAKLADAYAKTDWRAKQIMQETIDALVNHVAAVVQRLALKSKPFDLVVVGGLFEITSVPLLHLFAKRVLQIAPKARIVKPQHSAVWGALRLAQDALH